jgi:hypothetical protein
MSLLQIEERKQHQARLLDQLNSIQVPSINTPSPTFPNSNAPRMVSKNEFQLVGESFVVVLENLWQPQHV